MRNIAVIARKGGSGKSTIAFHLATCAHRDGLDTVIADTDPQRSVMEVMRAREGVGPQSFTTNGPGLKDLQRQAEADGCDAFFIDTPAAAEAEIAHAIATAHLAVLVVRPTFLDIAASVQTAQILRSLRKPGLILLNQAPVPRGAVEPPAVKRALEALQLMRLPVIPTIIRSRVVYQTALATGRSAAEVDAVSAAARDMNRCWAYIERFVFGAKETRKAG
jgi:chromosome partitioning protein